LHLTATAATKTSSQSDLHKLTDDESDSPGTATNCNTLHIPATAATKAGLDLDSDLHKLAEDESDSPDSGWGSVLAASERSFVLSLGALASHCNALQRTATHCDMVYIRECKSLSLCALA